jgi:hypothetical protein
MHDAVFRVRKANEDLNKNQGITDLGPQHRELKLLTRAIHEERQRLATASNDGQGNSTSNVEVSGTDGVNHRVVIALANLLTRLSKMVIDDTNEVPDQGRQFQKLGRIPKNPKCSAPKVCQTVKSYCIMVCA